jgi:serine/threonine protein kinase
MSPPDPLVGSTLAGRYRIGRLVATGATGRVYRAEQLASGRPVALKILARARQDLAREASLLSRLHHPHTVRVYEHGLDGELAFLAMEYVDGVTLRALMKDGPLDPLRACRLARQICGSLGEAHELGMVHRDLKPANLLVARGPEGDDLVKVVDFGLVEEVADAVHTTSEGQLLGTPMFMAPEQIRGRSLDQRCDIYALGVVLYHMLTGTYPFREGEPASVLVAHLTESPRPLPPELDLPEVLAWTVARCLEKEPAQRFAHVRELHRALQLCEAALLDEGSAASVPELVDGYVVTGGQRRARPRWLELGLTLGATLGALSLLLAFSYVLGKGYIAVVNREAPAPPPLQPVPVAPDPVPERRAPLSPAPVPAPAPIPRRSAPEPVPEPLPEPVPWEPTTDLVDPWPEETP